MTSAREGAVGTTETQQRLETAATSVGLNPRGRILALIVFIGGVASIAIETAASRLIAPFFGTSTFIWANLIGLTLLYLTVGYFLGGRIADRWPAPRVLYLLTGLAGASVAFIPFVATPILSLSLSAFDQVNVGVFIGSLLGTILLFAAPITLLGLVSPFAVRLRIEAVTEAGNTAGSLYAISTVGSIIGSLLPAFVLIPLFGTHRSFLVLALALLVPSIVALLASRAVRHLLAVGVLTAVAVVLPILNDTGLVRPTEYGTVIHEAETRYNYVQVAQRGSERLLVLNEGHAIHSIYDPNSLLTRGPWDYFMVGSFFQPEMQRDDVDNMLMIGLAAGTVAKQFTQAYGPIPIDGVEIDGELVEIGREYFNMNEPNLDVHVADGRYFLNKTDTVYDVVGIDAYRQPYIPFHLTTKEFFQEVSNHMTDEGVAVVNAGRTEDDYRLVHVIAETMETVFSEIYLIDVGRFSNTMVIGVKGEPSSVEAFNENINSMPQGSLIRRVGEIAIDTGNIREWNGDAMVFTDDKAPVERVVDQIILEEAQER